MADYRSWNERQSDGRTNVLVGRFCELKNHSPESAVSPEKNGLRSKIAKWRPGRRATIPELSFD
jgi:hypothetical protein